MPIGLVVVLWWYDGCGGVVCMSCPGLHWYCTGDPE